MKKLVKLFKTFLLCIAFACTLSVQGHNLDSLETPLNKELLHHGNYWAPVITAIAKVESSCNTKAISKSGKYVGYLQIGPSLVTDCNNYLKSKGSKRKYTLKDRYNKEKSIEMFIIYMMKYNKSRNVEKAIRIWNGGSGYTIKGTQAYYNKVMRHLTTKS